MLLFFAFTIQLNYSLHGIISVIMLSNIKMFLFISVR
jgi:hypothetical protein